MPPHAPHDDVYDIAISPDFADDQTLFVVCRDMFLRSHDSGKTFKNLVTGLNNMSWFFTDKTQRFSLDISPRDKKVLFFASRGDGIYRSTDEGSSWTKLDTGEDDLDISLLVVSPHSSDVVLGANARGGLVMTSDGGDTWHPVGGIDTLITAIVFSPDSEDLVLVGDEHGTFSVSEDSGIRWRSTTLAHTGPIRSIAISPDLSTDETIVVGTAEGGVHRSTDFGVSFAAANEGLGDLSISSVVFSPNFAQDSTLWVSTWTDGVYVSNDRATSWTQSGVGLTTDEQKDEEAFHDRPHFGYLRAGIEAGPERNPSLFLAGFDGLFHSTDGGRDWHEVETLPSSLNVSLAVSPNFEHDSTIAMTTYVNGAFLSEDAGDTWNPINNGLGQRSLQERQPDYMARLFGIQFSPDYANDNTLFCALWTRFIRSDNRGKKWIRTELDEGDRPRNQKVINAVSPTFSTDRTMFLANRYGDVYKSTDGGASFSPIVNLGGHIRALVISPNYAEDGTLFAGAGTRPHQVHASFDGGETWTPAGERVGFVTHLAISPDYATDRMLFAGTRTGLLVTTDQGQHWQHLARARDATESQGSLEYIEAVAISPDFANDETMLISVSGRGLYRSVDRGSTFSPIGPELLSNNQVFANIPNPVASPIVFSPSYATDRTIFGYSPTNVLRSTDAGETWTDITQPKVIHATGGRVKAPPALRAATQTTLGRRLQSAARRLAGRR